MATVGAVTAIVSAAIGGVQGDQQRKAAKRARRRQGIAQQSAMSRQSATAARARAREEQTRRGRQLAIANAARVGAEDRVPTGTGGEGRRTLG